MRPSRTLVAAIARRLLSPFVTSRNALPFACWLNRISADSDPYLVHLDRFCGSAGIAIDVGANEGLYTYPLSRRFKRVYAFEMNSEITGSISAYDRSNIELIHCGLSSAAGTARFYIPVAHGLTLTGWGTVHRDVLPPEFECIEKECRVAPLDDFGITDVGFMKVDVEGHEMEVLKGAAKTIEQSRPVVLIEVRTVHEQAVDSWFLARNFRQCRLNRHSRLVTLTGVHPSTGNCLYIPCERLAQLGLES
jgi:FkbM family methyltransferase